MSDDNVVNFSQIKKLRDKEKQGKETTEEENPIVDLIDTTLNLIDIRGFLRTIEMLKVLGEETTITVDPDEITLKLKQYYSFQEEIGPKDTTDSILKTTGAEQAVQLRFDYDFDDDYVNDNLTFDEYVDEVSVTLLDAIKSLVEWGVDNENTDEDGI